MWITVASDEHITLDDVMGIEGEAMDESLLLSETRRNESAPSSVSFVAYNEPVRKRSPVTLHHNFTIPFAFWLRVV